MPDTATITEPWFVIEGFVVAPGTYQVVRYDPETETQVVLTRHGEAHLLEEAPGIEPTSAAL